MSWYKCNWLYEWVTDIILYQKMQNPKTNQIKNVLWLAVVKNIHKAISYPHFCDIIKLDQVTDGYFFLI